MERLVGYWTLAVDSRQSGLLKWLRMSRSVPASRICRYTLGKIGY